MISFSTLTSYLSSVSKTKKVVAVTVLLSASIIGSQVHAVYIVHDPKVYTQIVEQIKKATETINHLKTQIDMQVQNLQKLKKENIDPILGEIHTINDEYTKVKQSMNSLISGTLSAKDAYKDNFEDLTNLDYKSTSYGDINTKINKNRDKLEESNIQITELLSKKQDELLKSQERIKKLTALIPEAKGAKDLAQLQNLISAEQVNSTNISNEITALQAKQQTIKTELEKLEKDGSKAILEKTSSDFNDASQDMLDASKSAKKVKTQTSTLYKIFENVGWR